MPAALSLADIQHERTERHLAELEKIPMENWLQGNRLRMEATIRAAKDWPRKPDRNHRVPQEKRFSGWLFPILQACEMMLWGRWYWHTLAWAFMRLPDEPIPQIAFVNHPDTPARNMLGRSLDAVADCGHDGWLGWGSTTNFDYFLDWLLFGFGHLKEEPTEPTKHAYDRLYQVFCLEAMLAWPYDYFGDMLAENRWGRGQGFFPTPMCVTEMMTRMVFGDPEDARNYRDADGKDRRLQTVNEPCVGTGRMLLSASNFSVRLCGQDISQTAVKATIVNGFMYAPWIVRPFSFLEPRRDPDAKPAKAEDTKPAVRWERTRAGNMQSLFAL